MRFRSGSWGQLKYPPVRTYKSRWAWLVDWWVGIFGSPCAFVFLYIRPFTSSNLFWGQDDHSDHREVLVVDECECV